MKKEIQKQTKLTKIAKEVKEGIGTFDFLILEWGNKVKLNRIVKEKTVSYEDAKDLRQEIYLNLFEKFNEFDCEKANFETWALWKMKETTTKFIRSEIKRHNPILANKSKNREKQIGKIVSITSENLENLYEIKRDNFENKIKDIEELIRESKYKRKDKLAMIFILRKMADEKKKEEITKSLKFWNLIQGKRPEEKRYKIILKLRKIITENKVKETINAI